MRNPSPGARTSVFEYEGIPPLGQLIPLGLQHVVAAIVGIVTPAILVGNVCGLSAGDQTLLIQISLIATALATLLQLFPSSGASAPGCP